MSGLGVIGVLMGGVSSEREVSLRSGAGVVKALTLAGHAVKALDLTIDDPAILTNQIKDAGIDVAFITLHGRLGEDGGIQDILTQLGTPFIGSGAEASRRAFDKIETQTAFVRAGLSVPRHLGVADGRPGYALARAVVGDGPWVVKPACEGSSIGITFVENEADWDAAVTEALKYGPRILIEAFVKGRELTAGVFDREALPLVEIRSRNTFFDYEAKYQKGFTEYIVPAEIPDSIARRVQALAVRAHDILGCEGFSRVDFRLTEAGEPYILEVNTIPGFTETSLFPKAAARAGYTFAQVCEKLIRLAYGKKSR